jgi:hypothetical protein
MAHLSVESIPVAENGAGRLLKSRVAFERISLGREVGIPLAEFG